jgi:HlyD family secretion protein
MTISPQNQEKLPEQFPALGNETSLGAPSKTGRIVVGVALFAFLSLLLWSFTAPLNRGVIAQGRVDVDGRRTTIKHRDGGQLGQVNVREGDRVQTGAILATMDDREAKTQLALLENRRIQLLVEGAVRSAETTQSSGITWPSDVLKAIGDPQSDAARWAGVQQQAFYARRAALNAQVSILGEQRQRLAARAQGLGATDKALRTQASLIAQEASSLRELQREGFAPRNRVLGVERSGADIQGRIGDNQSAIAQSRIAMGESEMQIVQSRAQALEGAAQRLTEINVQLSEIEDRISAQTLVLERTVIRSPVDGIILARASGVAGAVIQPLEPIFEVVPSDRLVIRAEVRPTDIERLVVGQTAGVRFSGLNAQTTPRIAGRVSFVGADAQSDRETKSSFYEIRVDVSLTELQKLGNQPLRSGMPVEVSVDGGARTAWEYFMEPIARTFERAFKE